MRLVPKNWAVFQHYKDRCPPWIKLHRELLNDRAFMCLPLASKALAPLLWLLASESKDGSFDANIEELQFRLRIDRADLVAGLKPLIDNGFFHDTSGVLADCLRDAIPETEGEKETKKRQTPAPSGLDRRFEVFWQQYPKKVGKDAARKAFDKRKPDESLLSDMLAAIKLQIVSAAWVKDGGQYIPNPATWLNQGRWQDVIDERPADVARVTVPAKQGPDPALQKIIADQMKAVPPPAEVREKLAALRQSKGFP